jgi:hypothetical protein
MGRDARLVWSKPFTLAAFSENSVEDPIAGPGACFGGLRGVSLLLVAEDR